MAIGISGAIQHLVGMKTSDTESESYNKKPRESGVFCYWIE